MIWQFRTSNLLIEITHTQTIMLAITLFYFIILRFTTPWSSKWVQFSVLSLFLFWDFAIFSTKKNTYKSNKLQYIENYHTGNNFNCHFWIPHVKSFQMSGNIIGLSLYFEWWHGFKKSLYLLMWKIILRTGKTFW